jgi:proline iminopeptidase
MASGSSARKLDGGEGYVPLGTARLFYRHLGHGRPIVVLHGGPDFNHNYLLPGVDRLADSFRLIYYDQRGRGRSADGVKPEDVTITSEVEDLEALRTYLGLERMAVLGHSWGGVLAMEYAVHHPDRVSHLILMNSAAGSYQGWLLTRQNFVDLRTPAERERMGQLAATVEYQRGSPTVEAELNRIHFRASGHDLETVERLLERLPEAQCDEVAILTARAIGKRLADQTGRREDFDVATLLADHHIPTLIIHGDRDFIPLEVATHTAETIPGSRLVVLADCGHFSYMDHPDRAHELIVAFLPRRSGRRDSSPSSEANSMPDSPSRWPSFGTERKSKEPRSLAGSNDSGRPEVQAPE